MCSCYVIVEGNFVLEVPRTVWAIIASRYDVLGVNVALDIVGIGPISTLGTFILPITIRHQ